LKHALPKILLYSRLCLAFAICLIALFYKDKSNLIVITLLYVGILTDVFDGIIARRLNISTDNFRLLDTVFDLMFYLSVLFYICIVNPTPLSENIVLISSIFILESLMYLISLLRFRKLPSPHAILSKFWGIYLVIEFTLLILGVTGSHFHYALIAGTLVHIDRVLIYTFLRKWDHDIPSCYHAYLMRQGKTIVRRKLFNG
jgi:phosphatidylglycerophosphate synthase